MERLGLGYDRLKEGNSGLIYATISGKELTFSALLTLSYKQLLKSDMHLQDMELLGRIPREVGMIPLPEQKLAYST